MAHSGRVLRARKIHINVVMSWLWTWIRVIYMKQIGNLLLKVLLDGKLVEILGQSTQDSSENRKSLAFFILNLSISWRIKIENFQSFQTAQVSKIKFSNNLHSQFSSIFFLNHEKLALLTQLSSLKQTAKMRIKTKNGKKILKNLFLIQNAAKISFIWKLRIYWGWKV